MRTRGLIALILSSALVTLDGTATNVALPAIGRELKASFSALQMITDASLLMLAVLLLPAGLVGDRIGRVRTTRAGLIAFAVASAGCALATSSAWLIAARLLQGAAAAFIVPGAIAILRAAYRDERERARAFGIWAGWSGLASAAGPLLGGALVDVLSWRAVFALSAVMPLPTLLLLSAVPESRDAREQPVRETIRTVLCSRNCVVANASTTVMYFGLFGISFLLAIYAQDVLGYSATWAGVTLLPIALLMLLLSERFGRYSTRYGPRQLLMGAPIVAAAGLAWIATGPEPLPFWSRIMVGTSAFGLGMAIAVAPLTHAAVSSLPQQCAGAASGINNATVRLAGFIAIGVLGVIASGGGAEGTLTADGFRNALLVCAAVLAAGGVAVGALIKDEERGGIAQAA